MDRMKHTKAVFALRYPNGELKQLTVNSSLFDDEEFDKGLAKSISEAKTISHEELSKEQRETFYD